MVAIEIFLVMSSSKKEVRRNFRDAVFQRDKYACVMCSFRSSKNKAEQELDAHHVTDRSKMPAQRYHVLNGISLCAGCHLKAEQFHSIGTAYPGYSPDELYAKIGSSHEQALKTCQKLDK
jgi:hypothetical protein